MSRSTLKRSVAALGVVAGILAAAGPASAQVMPGMIGVTAPVQDGSSNTVQFAALPSKVEISALTTPVDADSSEVAVEGLTRVVTNNNDPDTMGRTPREPARITMLDYEGNPVVTYVANLPYASARRCVASWCRELMSSLR